jgi:hypothetical protein
VTALPTSRIDLAFSAARNRVRQNAIFVRWFKLIWVVQSPCEKYFAFAVRQIKGTNPASCAHKRGVAHRHERGAGDAVDAANIN